MSQRATRSPAMVGVVITQIVLVWSSLVLLSGAALAGQPEDVKKEIWKGVIEIGPSSIEFVVKFAPAAAGQGGTAGFTGTMDIPVQGLTDGALQDVVYTQDRMAFTLVPPGAPEAMWAKFSASIDPEGKTAQGELNQSGGTFPITLERLNKEQARDLKPKRPQMPVPPFPYTVREVEYDNDAGGVHLAGTLTIPEGDGPHPAAILITGSGPQDRDESIMGHKPFLVIADHLTRHGIAVLRVDDRGVGGSTGSISDSTTEDFAGDVMAGIEFLRQQRGIDASKIGLIGHSEGALVAPIVAAQTSRGTDEVAFVVLLAGPGLPGAQLLSIQLEAILRASGVSEESIAKQIASQGILTQSVLSDEEGGDDRAVDAIRELVREQMGLDDASEVPEAIVDAQLAQMNSPWFRYFLALDPRPYLKRVKCPVLALNGALDLQVPAERNLNEISRALAAGGNDDVTTSLLPGLNHLFQEAATGLPAEYAQIPQTFAPGALKKMTDWIRLKTGLDR